MDQHSLDAYFTQKRTAAAHTLHDHREDLDGTCSAGCGHFPCDHAIAAYVVLDLVAS